MNEKKQKTWLEDSSRTSPNTKETKLVKLSLQQARSSNSQIQRLRKIYERRFLWESAFFKLFFDLKRGEPAWTRPFYL